MVGADLAFVGRPAGLTLTRTTQPLLTPNAQNAMRYPKAHTVLEACALESKEFELGSVDAVLVSKPDGTCISDSVDYVYLYVLPRPRVSWVAGPTYIRSHSTPTNT